MKLKSIQTVFLFFTCFALKSISLGEQILEAKQAFFHFAFWSKGHSDSFVYYPWGNVLDENASKFLFRINATTLSKPITYHGTSPLNLYTKSSYGGNSFADKELKPVISYHFDDDLKKTSEKILFIEGKEFNEFKLREFDFSLSDVPVGSFIFQSYAKEAIFFQVEQKKFRLLPSEQKLLKDFDFNAESSLEIKGFLRRKNSYISAFSQTISYYKKKRGVIWFGSHNNSIIGRTFMSYNLDRRKAIGYSAKPTIIGNN